MIDAWGGWGLFQDLLKILKEIADKYVVSIANIATRYILDIPKVAGVIVGIRLDLFDHREDNAHVRFALRCIKSGVNREYSDPVKRSLPHHRR